MSGPQQQAGRGVGGREARTVTVGQLQQIMGRINGLETELGVDLSELWVMVAALVHPQAVKTLADYAVQDAPA